MEEEKQTASITIPSSPFDIRKIKQKINELFELPDRIIREKKLRFNFKLSQFANGFNLQQLKFNKSKLLKWLFIIILVVILIAGIKMITSGQNSSTQTLGKSGGIAIASPISTKNINKDFKFSLRDDKGKEISTFTYVVESVELRKEIMVKGQKATAIKGRVFLIINLKLVNTIKQGINVNARDYLRLSVNGNASELLAPEIHSDPVEVQAISTKYTRVGFAINENDKNYLLQIGEIDGGKESIKLNFK